MILELNDLWTCEGMTSPAGQHQASSCQDLNLKSLIPTQRWNRWITMIFQIA